MNQIRKVIVVLFAVVLVGTIFVPSDVSAKTLYYGASHWKGKDTSKNGMVSKITLKEKKIVLKGSLVKASKQSKLYSGKAKYYKSKKRTFKLAKNVKFYGVGGTAGKQKLTRSDVKVYCKNANGLYVVLKVKNGKVVAVSFCS